MGKYAKFITALVGVVITVLSQRYGSAWWVQDIILLATALGVWGVPNTPAEL